MNLVSFEEIKSYYSTTYVLITLWHSIVSYVERTRLGLPSKLHRSVKANEFHQVKLGIYPVEAGNSNELIPLKQGGNLWSEINYGAHR